MSRFSTPPPPPPPPPYRSPGSRPPASKGGVILLTIIVATLIAVGSGVTWQVIKSHRLPPRVEEDTATKHRETAEAFDAGGTPASDGEETARIKACIDLFTAALVEKDANKLNTSFDSDRLLEELDRMHVARFGPRRIQVSIQ